MVRVTRWCCSKPKIWTDNTSKEPTVPQLRYKKLCTCYDPTCSEEKSDEQDAEDSN